ncbi:hypothetical protein PHYBOEH_008325 [Phytophthora boehmeriae]|uniref:BZIP domain-containing protein n=1 Tax=Phytophthora boehmeriae TaxID=109152 RepID=A0A8T1W1G8_9STRA|nr:hypothetical protein PHYBOEH_008325 [Phytophthora boehmeriae]
MATDDSFLADLDDFLISSDLPTFSATDDIEDSTTPVTVTECVAVDIPDSPPTHSKIDDERESDRAKDRKRRRVYRERRRFERETLQQRVEELSQQLTELEKANDFRRQLSKSPWKMIAQRQYQARLRAEASQRQLIAAVDARSALIKDFKEFIREKLTNDVDGTENLYQPKRTKLELSDAEFYEAYLEELDTLYGQCNEALRECGVASTDLNWEGAKWREEDNAGFFTYADKFIVALDFEQTCESLWRLAQLQHRHEDRQSFGQVEDPENTSAYSFRVTTQLKSGQVVSMHQRLVARRYKEDGRGVNVWRSFTEGEGIFTGMHSDETGWVVAIPLPGQPEAGTLVRTCIRHRPMHFSRVATQDSTAKQFTGAVLGMVDEDDLEITSKLGKIFLNDT